MDICAGDRAHLVGVGAERFLQLHSDRKSLTVERARVDFRWDAERDEIGELLEAGEFVVRRQEGVGLRLTLGLRHLKEWLICRLAFRIAGIHRPAKKLVLGEHPAIRDIGVMRDREDVDALVALDLEKRPEILRID